MYSKEQAWACNNCPKQIQTGEREENFEAVECHVSDGINMGTIENDIKGFTDRNIFEEEVDKSVGPVKGIEAKERTFLNMIKHRKILKNLPVSSCQTSDVKKAITQLNKFGKSPNLDLVRNLLIFVSEKKSNILEPFRLLISELGKCTPISVLLPSHDQLDYRLLKAYLDEEHNV